MNTLIKIVTPTDEPDSLKWLLKRTDQDVVFSSFLELTSKRVRAKEQKRAASASAVVYTEFV